MGGQQSERRDRRAGDAADERELRVFAQRAPRSLGDGERPGRRADIGTHERDAGRGIGALRARTIALPGSAAASAGTPLIPSPNITGALGVRAAPRSGAVPHLLAGPFAGY
jgi:hypothetical protein